MMNELELSARLQILMGQFQAIEQTLELAVIGPIRGRTRPVQGVAESIGSMIKGFDSALAEARSLGLELGEECSVPDILAALELRQKAGVWESFCTEAESLLTELLGIRVSIGVDSPTLVDFRGRVSTMLGELAGGNDVEAWELRIAPYRDFRTLLSQRDSLSEDESDTLTARVEVALGRALVKPSLFPRLVLDVAPLPASAEVDLPMASPEPKREEPKARESISEESVVELDPTPEPEPTAVPPVHVEKPAEIERPRPVSVERVEPLPEVFRTFDLFAEKFWLNPISGSCEVAPWVSPDFGDRLEAAVDLASRSVADGNWGKLAEWSFLATALEKLGRPSVRTQTIHDMATVYADPAKVSIGRDASRCARLEEPGTASSELQLGLVLEALRPTHDQLPYGEALSRLIERANFKDVSVGAVVSGLLKHHEQSDTEPTAQIRAALSKAPPKPIDWKAELEARRTLVHNEVKRITQSGTSGAISKYTHCRRAWIKFLAEHVHALAKTMYPGEPDWNTTETDRRIDRLTREHAKIADDAEAKFGSRKSMDRAVEKLQEVLREANDAMKEWKKPAEKSSDAANELAADARFLLTAPMPSDPVERLARRLLERVLDPSSDPTANHPLTLNETFFAAYPSLLDLLDESIDPAAPPLATQLSGRAGPVAAALLFPRPTPPGGVSWREIESSARDERRFDRVTTIRGTLPLGDQPAAAQDKTQRLVAKHNRIEQGRKTWRKLEALVVPSHKFNRATFEWAKSEHAEDRDPKLVEAWLERVAEQSASQVAIALQAWEVELADDAARLRALREGEYDFAIRGQASSSAESSPLRETSWRVDAAKEIPNPRRTLFDLSSTSTVAKKWTTDLGERANRHNTLTSLLNEFTKWVFGELRGADVVKERTRFSIETDRLRRHLIQPSYLPQLHAARKVVVVTIPESPAERDYPRKVFDTAKEYGENSIVVLLCPGMTSSVRDQVRGLLQRGKLYAGTIDDLDLCRLLDPRGITSPIVGLLEIVLEQQLWKARNPFSVPEGSEMRLEMYVGRDVEATQLATTSDKTRLFSGRKLGKTALLQYIRQKWDCRELPNGRRLRVVYVSIVGVDKEDLFAKKVLNQLHRDFPGVALPQALADPTGIIEALRILMESRPDEDLLIVLDEADDFVSAQIQLDKKNPSTGLSWKLRESCKLYPVRYVFTGYRSTSTWDGVWYNWGDVLELSQLGTDEAAGLIARPLARLGIDASEQAAEIAFRCGYQPAVLLRFGERLVERMAEEGYHEGARVGHELVQDTFEDAKVATEIQGVVRSNFQGNPFGQAIFVVVLQESAKAPGHWLKGLDAAIVDAFQTHSAPGSEPVSGNAIASQLRDMQQRKLLRHRRANEQSEYQLSIPHHLPTLLSDLDFPSEIKANLRAWRETDTAGETTLSEGRSPIHRSDLATLREMLREDMAELVPDVVAIGSLWPVALTHEPGGIPDRLELGRAGRSWKEARVSDLEHALSQPVTVRPLFLLGGIELLREGIAQKNRSPSRAEAFGPHRMSDGQIRWWFQRVLGVEFASEHVYDEVHLATAGVPLLVGEFQNSLLPEGAPEGGASLGAERVAAASAAYAARLTDRSFARAVGEQLTDRERALMRMTRCIGDFLGSTDSPIGELLTIEWNPTNFGSTWERVFPGHSFPTAYLTEADDPIVLETLTMTGLVPSAKTIGEPLARIQSLNAKDPIVTLLANFG